MDFCTNNQNTICQSCAKPVAKSGSMTQWIFDSSKCTCAALSDDAQDVQRCALCGLTLKTRKGSITQWIFRTQTCTCFDKGETDAVIDVSVVPPNDSIAGSPYEFIGVIGHGGLGTVYKARSKKLDRFVAIKTLNSGLEDKRASQNFVREAKSASKLQHPNVVAVQDFGTMQDGKQYLVTEWIDGITLEQYLSKQATITLSVAHEIFSQVLDGLSHAHKRGVVHRDIKPGNIMLARAEYGGWIVKIIDFGTAKEIATDGATTRVEDMAVSPYYMSPEQSVGAAVDHRADLYSLGCTLFETLTGRPPFRGMPLSVVTRHQTETPPTLQSASGGVDYPDYIENIVAKLLAKQPQDRFQNADEVKTALLAKHSEAQQKSKQSSQLRLAIAVLGIAIFLVSAMAITTMLSAPKRTAIDASVSPHPSPRDTTLDTVLGEENMRVRWDDEEGNRHGLPLTSSLRDIPCARAHKLTVLGDYNLDGLSAFTELEEISLEGLTLSEKDLKKIAALPKTRKICLKECYVPRNVLALLEPAANHVISMELTGLDLREPQMADLAKFRLASRVCLTGNNLSSAAAIAHLKDMPQLEWLCINSCALHDDGLREIRHLPRLKELNVNQASITNDGCKYIKEMPRLQQLHIAACPQLGDDGLKELAKAPRLERLDVSQSQVSDKGLQYVKEMPALTYINLDGCKGVTESGVNALKKVRPNLVTKFTNTSHLKDLFGNY